MSEGVNPHSHAFYRVYQARHTPVYDLQHKVSPCLRAVDFVAREGFVTPLPSFEPPPFREWVKDWFYYRISPFEFNAGKAVDIRIINNFEPFMNLGVSRSPEAFLRVSGKMTLREILEGFTLWSAQDRVTSFLGKFSQTEWVEQSRRGIGRRINRVYLGFDTLQSEYPYPEDSRSDDKAFLEPVVSGPPYFSVSLASTIEMGSSTTHIETPEIHSAPRDAEIPSPARGCLLTPSYSTIFEEPLPTIAPGSAPLAEDPIICQDSSSVMPSTELCSFSLADFGLSIDAQTGKFVDSEKACQNPFAGSLTSCSGVKSIFALPKKASFRSLLGKRKFGEPVATDVILSEAVPSLIPSVGCSRGSSDSGDGEIDIPAILSFLKVDLQDVGPLGSFAQKLWLPKVELGLSNFDSEVLLRSLIAHQVKSITLTQACARQSLPSEEEISKISSLEASLAKADEALRVSSSAVSRLEHETASLRSTESGHEEYISLVEKNICQRGHKFLSSRLSDLAESKVKLSDVGFVASLCFCGLLKELLDTIGAGYDNLLEDASPEDVGEWLRVNLKGLIGVCRGHSYDAVILMIRDLLHSFLCNGSDAIKVITQPSFSAKVSDPGSSYGAVEARCLSLIDEFWWKRVKTSLWDRLPRGIVKELTRGGFKRGDALPQELVDHFEELDRLTRRNALVEVPAQPVPLAVVLPGVIIISDDEGPDEPSARPSQCSGVASRTRMHCISASIVSDDLPLATLSCKRGCGFALRDSAKCWGIDGLD
ncbi:hypothetical protein EJB05_01857, partial [Eragrostis curvula]